MYAAANKTWKVSFLRRGILFLLVFAMMASLFGTALAVPADAASYKVKAWKEGNLYCYYVYTGSLPKNYEPTFCRWDRDVYKSGSMKVSFYWQFDNADEGKATALWQYLGNNSATSWTAGSYWTSLDSAGTEKIHYVYLIEGWCCNTDSIYDLLDQGPFKNSEGEKLYLKYLDCGNVLSPWSDIRDSWECSAAFYLPRQNATIGFQFIDPDGYIDYRYTTC